MNRLGVDVGGVIIDRERNDNTDTSFFSDNFLKTTAVPDAFEFLAMLNKRFNGEVYIVSKASDNTAKRTVEWMQHHDFFNRTGIQEDRLIFCYTRAEKAPICEKLGITHFIDDKLEVLNYLPMVPFRYLFRPSSKEAKEAGFGIRIVESWEEFNAKLVI